MTHISSVHTHTGFQFLRLAAACCHLDANVRQGSVAVFCLCLIHAWALWFYYSIIVSAQLRFFTASCVVLANNFQLSSHIIWLRNPLSPQGPRHQGWHLVSWVGVPQNWNVNTKLLWVKEGNNGGPSSYCFLWLLFDDRCWFPRLVVLVGYEKQPTAVPSEMPDQDSPGAHHALWSGQKGTGRKRTGDRWVQIECRKLFAVFAPHFALCTPKPRPWLWDTYHRQ